MAKTIVVLGVTGTQGGSVATKFLSLGWHVRGVTRSTTSPSAQALASKGIKLVVADMDDTNSLITAFSGAHAIFAMTDFWAPFFTSYPTLSQVSDRATGEHAFAIEVQRGKNLVDAAAKVLANESILERFVYSTLPSFKEQSGGKYTYNYHFDSKAVVSEYLKGKKELWEKSSLLNMAFYANNLIKYGALMGTLNNHIYICTQAGAPNAIHPFVVPADTGIFMDLLVRSPPKQDLLAVNEMVSWTEFMKIWTEVTGVKSVVKEVTVDDIDKAAPGGVGREPAESMASSAEFGWGEHLVMPKDLDPALETTSLRKYMEGEDWSSILGNSAK